MMIGKSAFTPDAARLPVANDNNADRAEDALMRAALRHFGEHRLGAGQRAAEAAEAAFFAGDRPGYDWWRSVCRALDRRLAMELGRRLDEKGGGVGETHQL